jgi:hypothetical protein
VRITKPDETVDVCDFCQRPAYLQTCDVCGRQFCLSDEGRVAGSWGFTRLCRECDDRADVRRVCQRYAEQLTPVYRRRNAALKRLGKRAGAVSAG